MSGGNLRCYILDALARLGRFFADLQERCKPLC